MRRTQCPGHSFHCVFAHARGTPAYFMDCVSLFLWQPQLTVFWPIVFICQEITEKPQCLLHTNGVTQASNPIEINVSHKLNQRLKTSKISKFTCGLAGSHLKQLHVCMWDCFSCKVGKTIKSCWIRSTADMRDYSRIMSENELFG